MRGRLHQAREDSPVAVKHAGQIVDSDGRRTFLYWMKAKTKEKHASPLQKVRVSLSVLCDLSADMACESASWLMFLTFTCTSHLIY